MTKTMKVAALTAALAVALSACGTDDNSTAGSGNQSASAGVGCAAGKATGAGSTIVATLAQQWIKDFGNRCPDATIGYQALGSGAGITQHTEGTVDFAGSDATLKPDEASALSASG